MDHRKEYKQALVMDASTPMYANANAAAAALQDKRYDTVYYKAQNGRTVEVDVERVTEKHQDYTLRSYRLWIAYADGERERIFYQYYDNLKDVKARVRQYAR